MTHLEMHAEKKSGAKWVKRCGFSVLVQQKVRPNDTKEHTPIMKTVLEQIKYI